MKEKNLKAKKWYILFKIINFYCLTQEINPFEFSFQLYLLYF